MTTIYLKQPKSHKHLYFILGGTFMLQGVINLTKEDMGFTFWFGVFQLAFSVLCILYSFSIIKPESIYVPKIYLGEDDITFHTGMPLKKPKTIAIEDIKLFQLKPEELTLMTNTLDFSYSFKYNAQNKQEIINELAAYAKGKNLPIERVPYRNV